MINMCKAHLPRKLIFIQLFVWNYFEYKTFSLNLTNIINESRCQFVSWNVRVSTQKFNVAPYQTLVWLGNGNVNKLWITERKKMGIWESISNAKIKISFACQLVIFLPYSILPPISQFYIPLVWKSAHFQ